ncbi:MAG: hypothetical protein ACRC5H_06085 [Treponemataceae bacterium]
MCAKKTFLLLVSFCIFKTLFAYIPTNEDILHITARDTADEFFISDKNGFITQLSNEIHLFYQFSALPIKLFALNPLNNEIAIYETDSNFFHQITVWDWKTKEKLFSKKISDAVLTLSYSEQGSTLIVGTQSVKGVFFFNASDGTEKQILKESTGAITFAKSSASERNLILYSPQGVLSYYDFQTGQKRAQFSTEKDLQNISLYRDSVYLVGTKNDFLYKIQATSGKTIQTYKNQIASVFPSDTDFAFFEKTPQNYTLFFDNNGESESVFQFNLKNNDVIARGFSNHTAIMVVTQQNNFYIFRYDDLFEEDGNLLAANNPFDRPVVVKPIEKLRDFAFVEESVFALSEKGLYSFDNKRDKLTFLTKLTNYSNFVASDNVLAFYHKGKKNPLLVSEVKSPSLLKEVYTPQANIQQLSVYDTNIAFLEDHNIVHIYSVSEQKIIFSYKGTGIQDIFLSGVNLYVAKSSATQPNSSLIAINIETNETLLIPVKGNITFSLTQCQNFDFISGFSTTLGENTKNTQFFLYSTQTKQISYFLSFDDDAFDISTCLSDQAIYTTYDKLHVSKLNLSSKFISPLLPRSNGIPRKVMIYNNTDIATLTSNGTCFVYDLHSGKFLRELSIDEDGKLKIEK